MQQDEKLKEKNYETLYFDEKQRWYKNSLFILFKIQI
jgi:hypothetical protein